MSLSLSRLWKTLLFIATVAIYARSASGVLIGPTGEPSIETGHPLLELGLPIWEIELPDPIAYDGEAGPWEKRLFGPEDPTAPPSSSPPGPSAGDDPTSSVFLLEEKIAIESGSVPWTDWHEEIRTPGWFFEPVPPIVEVTPPGGGLSKPITATVEMMPDPDMMPPTMMWLFFDTPILPGSTLKITKRIEFLGVDGIPDNGDTYDGAASGPVVIHQHPSVPEPSAFALLAIVMAGCGTVRLWRRSQTR